MRPSARPFAVHNAEGRWEWHVACQWSPHAPAEGCTWTAVRCYSLQEESVTCRERSGVRGGISSGWGPSISKRFEKEDQKNEEEETLEEIRGDRRRSRRLGQLGETRARAGAGVTEANGHELENKEQAREDETLRLAREQWEIWLK
ncbi:hypothetical protein ACLOJK_007897 [Asimina triloba]